jgi:DNA polymerase-1
MKQDKILIFDFLNAVHRANVPMFFKKNMTEEQVAEEANKPDNGIVYGFFRNLRPLVEMFQPDKIFFALEGHSKFRYGIFPEYKANRLIKYADKKEANDHLHQQKDEILRLLNHVPCTTLKHKDYEGDDIIASLVEDMSGEDITIISGDKDFTQLLQKGYGNLKIYSPIKKEFMVAPAYPLIPFKSLVGDKSDGIPSVGRMGEKTALKLLADPKKFDEFLSVEENRARFNINRQLVEFQPVPHDEIIRVEGIANWELLKEEFNKLEFASITNDSSWTKYTATFNSVKF